MNHVGIDLGTTNSAIASFDGENVHLYKSPEQHDVTPSAIYLSGRAGRVSRYVGSRAYNQAAKSPDNVAILFKRLMGTSSPISIPALNISMTPEEASAEVLKTLVSYLPEEMRQGDSAGTVITVPAAFNQMQKDATLEAANLANIGKVALMQEPVAAVMSVMQDARLDGTFLIYDLGGGTLDIAIAESAGGRVNLLAHGGVAMLGGRDFDRSLYDGITKPWLYENFNLPPNLLADPKYRLLARMAVWKTEEAKIALSQQDHQVVSLSEDELGAVDLDGQEIYLDVPVSREEFDHLIDSRIQDSVRAAREAITAAGYSPQDIERIVYVGGPTQYKPLRDKVSFELGINASGSVNPMTAVATGAAIFAESIDWSSKSRGRKKSRETIQLSASVSFTYASRTPADTAKVVASIEGSHSSDIEVQFDSRESGWTSGRMKLEDGSSFDLPLPQMGDQTFTVSVHGSSRDAVELPSDTIVVTRTAGSVDGIPASHSIGIEAKIKAGGMTKLVMLVNAGDRLPRKGCQSFTAETPVLAGSDDEIRFKLWEGEIPNPVTDNTYIGTFAISGHDLEEGVISSGAELILDYEIRDSGQLVLTATVPSVGSSFHGPENVYSRQEGQINFEDAQRQVLEEQRNLQNRIAGLETKISDHRLDLAKARLELANNESLAEADAETTKQRMESLREAKKLLSQVRMENQDGILKQELQAAIDYFDRQVREYASPSEEAAFDNLTRTAVRAIQDTPVEASGYIDELWSHIWEILWKQDWHVQNMFENQCARSWAYPNKSSFEERVREGREAIRLGNMSRLRGVVYTLSRLKYPASDSREVKAVANIIEKR